MLNAVPGTFANDNTAALMTVSDVSTIWFTAGMQEKDLAFVNVGEEITATTQAYPGESFQGKVAFVSDQLDADTRTIKVRIAYPNADGRLRPGMFATVTLLGSRKSNTLSRNWGAMTTARTPSHLHTLRLPSRCILTIRGGPG
jgi:membrane fusion protein, heavy metal efflux system